jgi:hypothetical protein
MRTMKLSELRQLAVSLGVDGAALDEATDHDEPKSAVIELLTISHQRAESRASSMAKSRASFADAPAVEADFEPRHRPEA